MKNRETVKIGSFRDFDIYKRDDLNMYIKFHETGDVYTMGFEEGTLIKISNLLKEKIGL
ncbi:hypothetical protein [Paenibacillus naphthalenovorans]|uniref:Uncharacterized protein n=1 Tax=Paenibacillus naphthalenovorans TaxID=162209 RepID=A0A0U2M3Y0_9BACL|nr:hypothetical protein [Paenibacillus naphthalenovorans]ALS22176.1 hypothetical protein IJ22_18020 [Paenibacillus naphthalenovorans]